MVTQPRVFSLILFRHGVHTHTHKQYLNEVLNIQEVDFAVVLVYALAFASAHTFFHGWTWRWSDG